MSWSETFPVFSEDLLEMYLSESTLKEKAYLDGLFRVKLIANQRSAQYLVCLSLFSLPDEIVPNSSEVEATPLPEPENERRREIVRKRMVAPIIKELPKLFRVNRDLAVRIYLEGTLEFLVDELVEAGCEVVLMESSAVNYQHGISWGVLSFADAGRFITMATSARFGYVQTDLDRTIAMSRNNLACWREPSSIDQNHSDLINYRPISFWQMGAKGGWSIEILIKAFIWHSMKGNISTVCEMPGFEPKAFVGTQWSDKGFLDWFLAIVMYPRWAEVGMLTFVPYGLTSSLLLMDIEYSAWASKNSEMILYPITSCCGGSKKC